MSLRITLTLATVFLCATQAHGADAASAAFSLQTPPARSFDSTATTPFAVDNALPPRVAPSLLAPAADPTAANGFPVIELPAPTPAPEAIDLTNEASDLFERMRNGFAMPDINSDLVLHHQQWYLNRPDYLRRVVERSSLYLYHILEQLEERGMPTELALLPMVESAYNPMALSRAKASGLWQFIPATGKHYNLNQNWWIDERRDIVASTAAALDYLQTIYEMHGDWQLALASYNWGEGAVGRAVAKNQALGLPSDYQSLTMPSETRHYVPKLQALKNIFSDPALLAELGLPKIANRPYFATVSRPANIDVHVAAKLAGMPVNEFVALNPAHNRPIIQSETPMIIPADRLETFTNNLEAHEESKKPFSAWRAYTMRPGDKLESVASRFGMSVASLKSINGIEKRVKLSPGFTLLVSGNDGSMTLDPRALGQRLPEADPAPAAAASVVRSHTVGKGETLAAIARRYHVSVAELQRHNGLRSAAVKPGMRLAVAAASAKAQSEAKGKTGRVTASSPQIKPGKTVKTKIARYTIRRGDTLTSIARQFKVAPDDLKRWNRGTSTALTPGRQLTIELAQNP